MRGSFKNWMREDKRNERHVGESMKSGPKDNMNYAKQYDDDEDKESMYKRGKAMVDKGKMMMKMAGNDMGQDPEDAYGESAGLAPKIGNAKGESMGKESMSYSGRMKKGNLKRMAFKKKMQKRYESMS